MTETTATPSRPRNFAATCASCGQNFAGYSTKAKHCSPECKKTYRAAYLKQYHEERPGYQEELSRAYYKANAENLKAQSSEWYAANHDRAKATQRDYAERNAGSIRDYKRSWEKANQDKVKASRALAKSKITASMFAEQYHRRRARKATNGVYKVTARDMARCLARFAGACAYCSTNFTLELRPTWDHIVPISRGGQHSVGNLAPACSACNTSKWASTVTEWRKRKSSALRIL